jgi:hypothetical protein
MMGSSMGSVSSGRQMARFSEWNQSPISWLHPPVSIKNQWLPRRRKSQTNL